VLLADLLTKIIVTSFLSLQFRTSGLSTYAPIDLNASMYSWSFNVEKPSARFVSRAAPPGLRL
jgi:hypothetical protein